MKKFTLKLVTDSVLDDSIRFLKENPSMHRFYIFMDFLIISILQNKVLTVPACSKSTCLEAKGIYDTSNVYREFYAISDPRPVSMPDEGYWLTTFINGGSLGDTDHTYIFMTLDRLYEYVLRSQIVRGIWINPNKLTSLKLNRDFLDYIFCGVRQSGWFLE